MRNKDYECIRCGYKTPDKRMMKRHLYERKQICPGVVNIIDLTDEIKECIIKNRHYVIENPQVPTQTINFYNQYINFVNNMDPLDKLNKICSHQNIDLLDFEEEVDNKFHSIVKKLYNNKVKDYQLTFDHIKQCIDSVTSGKNIENLNIYYDKTSDKLKLYMNGRWESIIFDIGVKEIMYIIKTYYFDAYECYLCRQIRNSENSILQKSKAKEHLKEYYKIIISFDLEPFVKNKPNNKILYNDSDPRYHEEDVNISNYDIEEEMMNIYITFKANDIYDIKNNISKLIKTNSTTNIRDLNRKIMEMVKADDTFRQLLV